MPSWLAQVDCGADEDPGQANPSDQRHQTQREQTAYVTQQLVAKVDQAGEVGDAVVEGDNQA
jgi:hypothetical protein